MSRTFAIGWYVTREYLSLPAVQIKFIC